MVVAKRKQASKRHHPHHHGHHSHHQGSSCNRRDIASGFWVGIVLAIFYLRFFTRKPDVTLLEATASGSNTVTSSAASASVIPPAKVELQKPLAPLEKKDVAPATEQKETATTTQTTNADTVTVKSQEQVSVSLDKTDTTISTTGSKKRDFRAIGSQTGTDKVWGSNSYAQCKQDSTQCASPHYDNPKCRTLQGHFYDQIYNKWLGDNSTDDAEPFQFLEIGFFNGNGFDAYKQFLPQAETHSIEIACIEPGPREEGKWPWPNFAAENKHYQEYLDNNQLHCGDASDYDVLHKVWTTHMKRPDAPPLKVVVEDAAHIDSHMAMSLFFWFPRIEPGGILVIEDVQPIHEANKFRTHVLPQVLKDLHYCGNPKELEDRACFPTIWPLLESVHCEMHICVFQRNDQPSRELSKEESIPPPHALDAAKCLFQ